MGKDLVTCATLGSTFAAVRPWMLSWPAAMLEGSGTG